MDDFECRGNEKMLKKQLIINLLVAWCVHKQTATNLIEPKMRPLLWMEWQEILHEVGHPHLVRTIRGWPGSASSTERSHAIHGSHAIRGWSMPSADGMDRWGYSGNTSSKLAPRENDITAKPGQVTHESALKLGPNGKAAVRGLSKKSKRRSTLLILPLPPKLGFPEGKKLGFNGTTSTPPVAMGAQPPFPLHRM